MKGTLYVVATPIGNPEDITIRALQTFRQVDLIAAEDTRKTGRLLSHHQISCKMISCHEHNESRRTPGLLQRLHEGESIALVSDAGTPAVSDPGYRLVMAAIAEGIEVVPIPGVSAATASLSVSGLPSDSFTFVGFLPRKKGLRQQRLAALATASQTLILYESPKRVVFLIEEIIAYFGDRKGMLAREMTKPFEEFARGKLSEIKEQLLQKDKIRGECTLLVEGAREQAEADWERVRKEISVEVNGGNRSPADLAKEISRKYSLDRKKIYAEIVRLQRGES